LRAAPIAESRKVGRFTVRDIEVLDGAAAPASNATAPTQELLREAIRDSDAATTGARAEAARQALEDLKALKAAFNQHQPGLSLEFPLVEKLLRRAQQIFDDALGVPASAEDDASAAATGGNGEGHTGALRTRADARRQLESVCEFLERTEPAHPAPLLIRRAARLLDLSFLDIIRDIAPAAASQIEDLGGIRRE
jgi:type VI secretion system protein ImpA